MVTQPKWLRELKMKWTKRLIILVLLLVVLIPVAMVLRITMSRGVLQIENFNKITPGMTLSEVETLLGGPAGNYGRPWPAMISQSCEGIYLPETKVRCWFNDDCKLEVFTTEDRVVYTQKRFSYSQSGEMTFLEKVKYVIYRCSGWRL